eukprot:GHVU01211836.1.p1 GENE.GHVU01211836.1~~GHVU01211836.1.p1  ORF type:complete len:193 (+),score=1.82 GHVU01211836.1:47-625(+)
MNILGITFMKTDFGSNYSNYPAFQTAFRNLDITNTMSSGRFVSMLRKKIAVAGYLIERFIYFLSWVLPWSVLLLFLQSHFYRKGYVNDITYDNIFITKAFKELDRKRKRQGKKSTLPLRWHEKSSYIDSTSLMLSHREQGSLTFGIVICCILFIVGVFTYLTDYALYVVLDSLNDLANSTLTFKGTCKSVIS